MISKEIRYMLAIRRYGSITKAADSLFITQSALSKAVKNIERQQMCIRDRTTLIRLDLSVPDREQAEAMCNTWKTKSQEIYAHVMRSLLS